MWPGVIAAPNFVSTTKPGTRCVEPYSPLCDLDNPPYVYYGVGPVVAAVGGGLGVGVVALVVASGLVWAGSGVVSFIRVS